MLCQLAGLIKKLLNFGKNFIRRSSKVN